MSLSRIICCEQRVIVTTSKCHVGVFILNVKVQLSLTFLHFITNRTVFRFYLFRFFLIPCQVMSMEPLDVLIVCFGGGVCCTLLSLSEDSCSLCSGDAGMFILAMTKMTMTKMCSYFMVSSLRIAV